MRRPFLIIIVIWLRMKTLLCCSVFQLPVKQCPEPRCHAMMKEWQLRMQTCPCGMMVMPCIYHVMLLGLGSWEPIGVKWRNQQDGHLEQATGESNETVRREAGLILSLSGMNRDSWEEGVSAEGDPLIRKNISTMERLEYCRFPYSAIAVAPEWLFLAQPCVRTSALSLIS